MEFVAYYCLEYDTYAARSHPQWQVATSDGQGLIRDDTYAKWPVDCLRTEYGDYCLEQLEEIVSSYHPDALFLDIFGSSLCYCPACQAAFRERFGYELPKDPCDLALHREDIVDFLNKSSEAYLRRIKERLKAMDPTLAITTNFASHYPETFRRQLDYQFAEPILQDNWFSSAYTRDTAKGRFPSTWTEPWKWRRPAGWELPLGRLRKCIPSFPATRLCAMQAFSKMMPAFT